MKAIVYRRLYTREEIFVESVNREIYEVLSFVATYNYHVKSIQTSVVLLNNTTGRIFTAYENEVKIITENNMQNVDELFLDPSTIEDKDYRESYERYKKQQEAEKHR